jgi:quercetin dioxygenase-like cupin family protein
MVAAAQEAHMKISSKWSSVAALSLAGITLSALLGEKSLVAVAQDQPGRAHIAASHRLPQLDGRNLTATVVEVIYEPGEFSLPHSHPCAVIGYIVEGELRTEVKGGPPAIYKAGESFYEAPNGVHLVSANASKERRARFLAYFVCDHDTPLSVDAPGNQAAGERK